MKVVKRPVRAGGILGDLLQVVVVLGAVAVAGMVAWRQVARDLAAREAAARPQRALRSAYIKAMAALADPPVRPGKRRGVHAAKGADDLLVEADLVVEPSGLVACELRLAGTGDGAVHAWHFAVQGAPWRADGRAPAGTGGRPADPAPAPAPDTDTDTDTDTTSASPPAPDPDSDTDPDNNPDTHTASAPDTPPPSVPADPAATEVDDAGTP